MVTEQLIWHPQLCLELLLTTALRNRDRIQILWPPLHDVLALILGPNATRTSTEVPPLVCRAHRDKPHLSQPLLFSTVIVPTRLSQTAHAHQCRASTAHAVKAADRPGQCRARQMAWIARQDLHTHADGCQCSHEAHRTQLHCLSVPEKAEWWSDGTRIGATCSLIASVAAMQVERAALGLLRVVGRLLAYKEGADSLVNSLQLLPKMRTQLAWDLSPKTTAQVRR